MTALCADACQSGGRVNVMYAAIVALSRLLRAEAMNDAALRRQVTRGGARCGALAHCGCGRGWLKPGWDVGTALAR
jgi:hypothetical protein